MPRQPKDGTMMLTRSLTIAHDDALNISENNITSLTHNTSSKFDQPLPADTLTKGIRLKSYCIGLAPQPSTL